MQVLLSLAFALGAIAVSAQSLTPSQRAAEKRLFVGIVNADTVWLDEYSREVGRLTEMASQRGDVNPSDLMEQAWNDLVRRRLMLREAGKRGITLELRQVDSILLEATPDYIKRGVVDDRGKFDKGLLTAMLRNPDSLISVNSRGMTTEQRASERAQLFASIAQLRERIGLIELESLLRINVTGNDAFDTTGLYKRYLDAATSATADIILVPCLRDLPTPSVSEIQAFHKANAAEFTTPSPMRRLAFLAWPMTAAPIDSGLFLANVRRFISLTNTARSARVRDSIWNAVASTTSSGETRLSPDSANHAQFYVAVKGKKVGATVGPLMHPTGVHVLLVDTVHSSKSKRSPEISVRVIISEVEPSRQTIDSILKQVDEAAELYERGMDFGAVAGRFGRTIESSPWFTEDAKLYGSHRLVDVAFITPVNAACDPLDTPDRGAILAVVVDSVPAGPLPFEAAISNIADAIKRQRGCDERRQTAKTARGLSSRLPDGRLFVSEQLKEMQIARDLAVHADGMIGEVLFDPTAAREILAKPRPDLYDPFLAESGWYVVNITSVIKANDAEFPMWLEMRKDDLVTEQREKHWTDFISALRSTATIEDIRWVYFRY